MQSKTKTDLSPYIVNVQGKDFITFPGLLAEAHAQGLVGIQTELVNTDLTNPVMKATVTLKDDSAQNGYKVFSGYGDANVNNVAKKVAGALIRMSETRAIARALRFGCNIDMAALEEIDMEDNVISNKNSKPVANLAPKLNIIKKENKEVTTKVEQSVQEIATESEEAKSELEKPVEIKESKPVIKQFNFKKRAETSSTTEPNF